MSAATSRKKPEGVWEFFKTLIYAVLIALGIRSFLFEPFNIPSGSMIPTLLIGDYLFVSKFSYGYSRYSFPLGLPLFSGRILDQVPERGDVIVFRKPKEPDVDYIKRLVGLPGDHLQMQGGLLYINGQPLQRQPIDDYLMRMDEDGAARRQYLEALPRGRVHRIIKKSDHEPLDNTPEYIVPPKSYFMMGDNRDNSLDSRVSPENDGVGYVPEENLVGRAQIIFFSIDDSAVWYEPWTWPGSIRFTRLFNLIR